MFQVLIIHCFSSSSELISFQNTTSIHFCWNRLFETAFSTPIQRHPIPALSLVSSIGAPGRNELRCLRPQGGRGGAGALGLGTGLRLRQLSSALISYVHVVRYSEIWDHDKLTWFIDITYRDLELASKQTKTKNIYYIILYYIYIYTHTYKYDIQIWVYTWLWTSRIL